MDIVELSCYGYGYYSGAKYEESIVISKNFYDKIKDKVKDETVYLGELDGKHSEVEAEIDIISYTEEEILKEIWDFDNNDGECLYDKIGDICQSLDLDLDEEIQRVENYIKSLDTLIKMNVVVKKSNKDKVLDFIKGLN